MKEPYDGNTEDQLYGSPGQLLRLCKHGWVLAHSIKDGQCYSDPRWRQADEYCHGAEWLWSSSDLAESLETQ